MRDVRLALPGCGTLDELFAQTRASADGLSSMEAARRLASGGPNDPSPPRRLQVARDLARLLANPLVLLLLGASAVSALLGDVTDAAIIGTVLALSAALNGWQSARSQRAIRALRREVAPIATVRRDRRWVEVPRRDVVVGDLVRLAAGDLVPADARLVESRDLHVQQAALTGEAFPAEKAASARRIERPGPDAGELVFVGSSVVSGSATAVALATGPRTAFGAIAARLAEQPEETELERGMHRFGVLILRTVFFLVLFILLARTAMHAAPLQSLLFAVALAVGLTPEFLPVITTVTLASGALEMARSKVIVKHLPAIQNLGSMDVLCSDKTGTLTEGTVVLETSLDPLGSPSPRALELGALNSRYESGVRSPLDDAIVAASPEVDEHAEKTDELPFDFERRRLSVVLAIDGEHRMITKGAPESVIERCARLEVDGVTRELDAESRSRSLQTFRALAERGARVLAVAWRRVETPAGHDRDDERELTLAGFLAFSDRLLPGIAESIAALRASGVTLKILSGDNELVAAHVCREVGILEAGVVLGEDIEHLDVTALARVAEHTSVFARVSPAQKHRIVQALQHGGHVVGFVGDGINDAPSLHGADVGISVAGAVDVAREASDIVLLERGIEVLRSGILAGRRSFGNVMKYLLMETSSSFGNMFSMAGAVLVLPFLPMLPTQILLNNFLYDLGQVPIPTDRVDPAYLAQPQRWDIGVIRDFMLRAGPVSSLFDVITFVGLIALFGWSESSFQTGWFVESLLTQSLVLFVIRTQAHPWKNRPSRALTVGTLLVAGIAVLVPYTPLGRPLGFVPLPASYFAVVVPIVLGYLVTIELVKKRVLGRFFARAANAHSAGGDARRSDGGASGSRAPSASSSGAIDASLRA